MEIVARPRQGGKTTEALRWLLEGRPVGGWPGWSRIIVTADDQRAQAGCADLASLRQPASGGHDQRGGTVRRGAGGHPC